jgi:hypothetical protein
LNAAEPDRRTLVTYDVRSIPGLIKDIIESGGHHGGVIFVDSHAIRSDDIGTIIRLLRIMLRESRDNDWLDRTAFLRPRR